MLDLYVNSFDEFEIRVDGFSNINETGGVTRVNYTIVGDLNSKTKYMLYYVPHSRDTLSLIYTLKTFSKSIISIVDDSLSLKTKNQLDNYSVMLRDFSFSGAVYIYYEDDILDNDQAYKITSSYREAGQTLQLRSLDFKLKAWDEIKLGRLSKMRRYKINNAGRIVPIGNAL